MGNQAVGERQSDRLAPGVNEFEELSVRREKRSVRVVNVNETEMRDETQPLIHSDGPG